MPSEKVGSVALFWSALGSLESLLEPEVYCFAVGVWTADVVAITEARRGARVASRAATAAAVAAISAIS